MLEKDVLGTAEGVYRERKLADSAADQTGLFISVNTICASFRSYNERRIAGQGSDCSFPVSQQMGVHFFTVNMECNVPHNAWQLS